jgi:hypothetical protein
MDVENLLRDFVRDTQQAGYKWYLGKLKILDLSFMTIFHKSQCPKLWKKLVESLRNSFYYQELRDL